jgi:hypothetical protein
MPQSPILKSRYGRTISVQPQVLAWRKLQRRWNKLRLQVLERLWERLTTPAGQPDDAAIKAWFNTPHPKLDNRTPKQLFNPRGIQVLWSLVRKEFK